jgi:hypothetical protein
VTPGASSWTGPYAPTVPGTLPQAVRPALVGAVRLHRANVLITPHSAAFTREALEDVRRTALAGVLRVLSGKPPLFPVPGLAADGAELVQSQRRSGQDEQAGETR